MVEIACDFCDNIESNPGPGSDSSDRRVRPLFSNIRGLQAYWGELAVAGLDHDVLVCAESWFVFIKIHW